MGGANHTLTVSDMATYVMNGCETSRLEKNKFISEVEKRRALWDKRLSKHKDRQLIRCLWSEVADVMNWDVEICKKTWKNLFDQFRHNYNQAVRTKARSDTIEDIEASIAAVKWSFFHQLMFLRDLIAKRRSLNPWTDYSIRNHFNFGRAADRNHNISNIGLDLHSEENQSTFTNAHLSTETYVFEECHSSPYVSEPSSSSMSLVHEALEVPAITEAPLCRPSIRSLARRTATTTNASTDTTYTEPVFSEPTTPRPQKRQRTCDSPEEMFRAFEEQMNSMDHVLHASYRPDSASIFGAYVSDLLKDVPADSRRRCELSVLQLMHSYLR